MIFLRIECSVDWHPMEMNKLTKDQVLTEYDQLKIFLQCVNKEQLLV